MPLLDASERQQLKLFAWFLLLINGCIVVGALALAGKLDDPGAGWVGAAALAVLVDGAFALIVGVNLAVVTIRRRMRRQAGARSPGERPTQGLRG